MLKIIGIILLFISVTACSVQKKIERSFQGKGREALIQEFGEPKQIIALKNGGQQFVYVKETFIRQTEIGTGSFTLDQRVSPSFVKEETYRFVIDKQGIIEDVKYERRNK